MSSLTSGIDRFQKSLTGIMTLSDGFLTIQEGMIMNCSSVSSNLSKADDIEVKDIIVDYNADIYGNLNVFGSTNILGGGGNIFINNLTSTHLTAHSGNIHSANIQEGNIKNIFSSNANIGNLKVFGLFEIENLQLDAFSGSKVLSTRGAHTVLSSASIQCKDIKGITGTILKDLNVLGNININKNLSANTLSTNKINLIPAGMIMTYVGNTEPEGWLFCRGQFISKTTYSDLFNVLGSVYGQTTTTFRLPNFQGCFLRGRNITGSNISGYSTGNIGTYVADRIKSHDHDVKYRSDDDFAISLGPSTDRTGVISVGPSNSNRTTTTELFGTTETAPYHSIVEYLIKF